MTKGTVGMEYHNHEEQPQQQMDPESLSQLPKEELVKIIIEQALVTFEVAGKHQGTSTRNTAT